MQPSQENNHIIPNQKTDKELEENINQKCLKDSQGDLPVPKSSEIQQMNRESHSNKINFAPFILNTLKIQVTTRSFAALNFYNEKHNLIISCFTDYTLQFFNADTLKNLKERTLKFPSYVSQVSFCAETDRFLFACSNGSIFIYDFSKNILTKHLKNEDHYIPGVDFIDSENYAFLLSETKRLYIGNLHYGVDCGFKSSFLLENKSPPVSLHCLPKTKFLLVGLESGEILSVKTHRLNTTPSISILGSVRGSEQKKWILVIKSTIISCKEYIITGGLDNTMRIWHFVKGKMRLLRVIKTEDTVSRIIYLEKYQMIVAVCRKNYAKFWRFCSGKLELKLVVGKQEYQEIFLMKEKNILGVSNSSSNLIRFVQLHSKEDEQSRGKDESGVGGLM